MEAASIRTSQVILWLAIGFLIGLLPIVTNLLFAPLIDILLFLCFFCMTFFLIYRKSFLFALYYGMLFVYTFFTQLGYLLYPSDLLQVSGGQYYGLNAFYPYWTFIFYSFISIFLLFELTYGSGIWRKASLPLNPIKSKYARLRRLLFHLCITAHNALMLYFLVSRYQALGYYTQSVLKGNFVFFYGFHLYQITILVLYVRCQYHRLNIRDKLLDYVGLFSSLLIFVVISVRAGQRIGLISLGLGIMTYNLVASPRKRRIQTLIRTSIAGIVLLMFLQGIRALRGSSIGFFGIITEIISNPGKYFISMEPKWIVFQDYLNPSLTLLTSIHRSYVFPGKVLRSNLINLLVLVDYPTLGAILSRLVDPLGTTGYGYYILTEGFNFMGWLGILYNAIIFNIGLLSWKSICCTQSKSLNCFMLSVIASRIFSVIRGQSFFFIKNFYFSFLPAAILYGLAMGEKLAVQSHQRLDTIRKMKITSSAFRAEQQRQQKREEGLSRSKSRLGGRYTNESTIRNL